MSQFLVAHRGASGVAPENTELAFDVAAAFGFDGVEFDVHLSKDGELVICHDETIDRTSDKTGQINQLTLNELKQADFSAKHELNHLPKQVIMTLDEFMIKFKNSFKIINIELKTDAIHYKGIEQKAYDVIKRHNAFDRVMFSAFNFDSIREMNAIDSNVKLAFLWENNEQWEKISNEEIKKRCVYLNPMYSLWQENKKEYESLKLMFNPWTVRERKMHEDMAKNSKIYSQISNFMW